MKVWTFTGKGNDVGFVDIELGQRATVLRTGGFLHDSLWGECATLKKVTDKHLIWITDSGAEVKTAVDNLFDVRGKAAKEGYHVSLGESMKERIFPEQVRYWNRNKGIFTTK